MSEVTQTDPPEVVATGEPPKAQPVAKPARNAPKWETDAKDRVRATIRKLSRPLKDLVERDANEGDTRLLVNDFLTDCLGYDKYEDLTTEYQVKGDFADYGMRIDKQLVAFIEVKRITTNLGVKHLRQVQMYAVNEGVEWLVLTSARVWQAYHVTGGLPVVVDLAFEVDLLDDSSLGTKAATMFYLSRESLKRRQIDELWREKKATSPKSLATALTSERVTDSLRKELRSTTGMNVDRQEIARLLRETVLRPDCLE